jgi:uncharacterized membrane protein YfcA
MFGLGGGIVIVPGLMFALRMDQRLAHGTSLAGVLPISKLLFPYQLLHIQVLQQVHQQLQQVDLIL